MLNEIIKTAEELNTAALYYRQSGNMGGVRELAKAHAVSKKQTEEFIQGSRYRLVDIPIEERKFANASEKLRAEMFALKDAGFADIIGQYLVNLAKTDSALDAQVLKKHKMAKRLGMDIHDSIIYRTRDLQLRHKEAVLKIEEMKRGIRRRELEEKYVGFQKHLIDLKEKYEFSDGEYQVIAPKSIDDILHEGDTLHHCVNKTDTYFDRIVSKESYILFLREKENPKVPFYTLEVEPDGTIRQKRAEFNRQNKDIDKVTSFLTLWQKEIQKRLTKKDRKSTEESRKLRQQNYQEIRDKHVVVHGGAFAGELLADLLEKDLMDLPVESAENEESPTEIAA